MLFKALNYHKQHDAEKSEKIHPKNIPLQIQSLGTRDFFGRLHTKKIVKNSFILDTAEKKFNSYAPRLITIYFVIILFQA